MTIDSSIALGVKPVQIDSPLNALAQMMQIKQAQQQNQLGDITMQAHQRDFEDQNKLRQLFAQPGFDIKNPDSIKQVMGISPSQGISMQKSQLDNQKAQGEIAKQQTELIDARLKQSRSYLDGVKTPEQYIAWHEANHKDPVLGPVLAARGVTADQARASIDKALQTPGGFEQLLQQSAMGIEKFSEMNKPTVHMQNLGGTSQIVSTPGMGGAPTILSNTKITQSPDSIASNATAIRGQNMTSATAAAGRESGKIPAGYRALKDGSLQAIPGGPADIKNSAESVKKVGEAKDVLSLLDEVDKLLPKATGSYVGAGLDSAAGAIGLGTKGAETTAQLKAIEGALISKMPKMSGPQSDKDVLLYRQMAGQVGDQTVPVKQRQAAADMVRKLNEKYAGMQDGSSRASSHVDSLLDKYK